MAENPTTSELVKAKAIAVDEVEALLAAYEAKPGAGPLPLSESYTLDVNAAIGAHPAAAEALNDPRTIGGWRWTMLRTAILQARPVKGE